MARVAARLCLASLAFQGAAVSPSHENLDAEALFQKEVRGHAEQFPGMSGLPKIPGFPGMGKLGGDSDGKPSLPAPNMQDLMKIMAQVTAALKNETSANTIILGLDELNGIAATATREMNERYAAFNASVRRMATKDVIPLTVTFMEAEMDALKPPMHRFMKSANKLIKDLPLGKKGQEANMMIAMAEPLMMQGFDDLMRPLKDSIEAMASKSTAAFCVGALPIVINASATVAPLRTVQGELQKAMRQLPQLKSSPMAFMMPRKVLPRLVNIGQKMLDGAELMLENFQAQAAQLNTTFRFALNEKLDCDVVVQSGAAPKGLGILTALASLAAWLAL